MQVCEALVAISGDRNNMVLKQTLTPPEILLLQQLHGADAVLQIEPRVDVKREPQAEIERLKRLYPLQHERIQNIWRDFPGAAFPVGLEMIGLNPALLKSAESSKPFVVDAAVV